MNQMLSVAVLAMAMLAALAAPALASTPADNVVGQAYGQHHAAMAQGGELGKDMNPGHHQGITGWETPSMP